GEDTETIEVKMGDSNTVEAMTTVVVEPTDVKGNFTKESPMTVRATITPVESGVYFIGFHGMSAADQYMLNLDNVKIESALNSGAPAAPSNLTVTPDAQGELKAKVSFTTPDKSIAGGAIWQNLTKVEILRDGAVVKTLSSVAPNSKESIDDTLPKAGTYTYAVRCYNMFGEGLSAYASAYVGINVPSAPESVAIGETVNEGEVTVSWSPVTTDIDGRAIPASKVTYIIAAPTSTGFTPLYEDLSGTSHTFMASSKYQDMVQYAVFAKTEAGVGDGTLSPMIPVGPAYTSLHESFANGTVSNLWGTQVINNAQFGIFNDESGYKSQDGDNGFLGMVGEGLEDSAAFFSGKISLAEMENPTLSFYTFNVAPNNTNTIEVGVKVAGAETYTTVKKFKISDICNPEEWGKVVIPLDAFKGKTIQFQLTGVVKIYPYIFIDNINVANAAANDLAITAITAPETVSTGTDYNVTVTVSNEGTKAASGYSVELFADGVKVDSSNGKALAAGESTNVTFSCHAEAISTQDIEYSASVVYANDENLDNNDSEVINVESLMSTLPTPENLKISSEGNGIRLTWSEPDLTKIEPVMITDDLEAAESFALSMKDWIFVDQDKSPVGGIDGASGGTLNIPNIIGGATTASFFVFDASLPQFGAALEAYSGNKYLAAMYRADNGLTDDWAISPELTGEAQSISFVAKSLSSSPEEAEHLQVLYSTGSTDPSDFIAVCDLRTVPSKWTKMSFNIPAGAKRFAIRSSSEASFMLMIDDITFTPAVNFDDYKVTGYNVYRESVRHNIAPVTATSYKDETGEADHRYVVTALYEKKGESGASNAASVSGISSVVMTFNVAVKDGAIVISGAGDSEVTVNALNGITVYTGHGDAKVNVSNGVYLVKVGKTVVKVLVK
ncbi:MAG: choice-of-anchor J domain-containing protein, partial [Muribaculaceae bacterium]|nr:choice-of-anchor J domain-containing protein [Muribaculaceae bacterium]